MLAGGGGNPQDSSVAYRDLLDLPGVGDDLLHHLHGLALALTRLALGRRCLHYLELLAITHLHGYLATLEGGREI